MSQISKAESDKLIAAKDAKKHAALSVLRGQKVAICIPTIDMRVDCGLMGSLLVEQGMMAQYGIQLQFIYQTDSLIQRCRNFLIHNALKKGADWYMWIDSDIRFQPGSILSLMAEDKQIIGGGYPIKCLEPERIAKMLDAGVKVDNILRYATRNVVSNYRSKALEGSNLEPLEVDNLGTGFLLTHRSVYDALKPTLESEKFFMPGRTYEKYEDIEYYYPYFDCKGRQVELFPGMPKVNDLLSEDYYFCEIARKVGIKSYVLPYLQLGHIGNYMYEGDFFRSLGLIYDQEKKSV